MQLRLSKKILYSVITILILIVLIVQSPFFGTPYTYLPIILMIAVVPAALMFLGTLIYDLIKKTRMSVNFLLAVLICLGSFWGSLKIVDMQIASTKTRVETINIALDKYFEERNEFPEKLDELIPKYMAEVPKTDLGILKEKFGYKRLASNNDYWLSFEELFKAKWIYVKSREGWVLDD